MNQCSHCLKTVICIVVAVAVTSLLVKLAGVSSSEPEHQRAVSRLIADLDRSPERYNSRLTEQELFRAFSVQQALIEIGEPAVAQLTEALRHRNPGVRINAAIALWEITRIPEPSLGVLVDALASKPLGWSTEIDVLVKMARVDKNAVVRRLLGVLENGEGEAPFASVVALGALESNAVHAIPTLIRILRFEAARSIESNAGAPSGLAVQVGRTLERIGVTAVEPVASLLRDDDRKVRRAGAFTLMLFKSGLGAGLRDLIAVLDADDGYASDCAAKSLGNMRGLARDALPSLVRAWQTRKDVNKGIVATALWRIDKEMAVGVGIRTKDLIPWED